MTPAEVDAYIDRLVAAAPPPSPEVMARVQAIFDLTGVVS